MAGIHTSNITSAANNGDVTIDPNGTGKTKIKSVDSTNPGQTPVCTTSDGTLIRMDLDSLTDIGDLAEGDEDWMLIQDASDSKKLKKIAVSEVLGGGGGGIVTPDPGDITASPPFLGGSGTENDPFIITPAICPDRGGEIFSAQRCTVTGDPGQLVLFDDISTGPAAGKFEQPPGAISSSTYSWNFRYLDTPTTISGQGQVYRGTINLGNVWFQWDVTQISNATNFDKYGKSAPNASPEYVDVSGDALTGTMATSWQDNPSTRIQPTSHGGVNVDNAIVFSVNGGAVDTNPKNITTGNTLAVSFIKASVDGASEGQTIGGALTDNAGFLQYFKMTKDITPSAFTIPTENGVELIELFSDVITPSGYNAECAVTISGSNFSSAQVSIGGGAYAASGNIGPGKTLRLKVVPAAGITTQSLTINVGNTSATWTVTVSSGTVPDINIISPADQSTVSTNSQVFQTSGFNMPGKTHLNTDWETFESGLTAPKMGPIAPSPTEEEAPSMDKFSKQTPWGEGNQAGAIFPIGLGQGKAAVALKTGTAAGINAIKTYPDPEWNLINPHGGDINGVPRPYAGPTAFYRGYWFQAISTPPYDIIMSESPENLTSGAYGDSTMLNGYEVTINNRFEHLEFIEYRDTTLPDRPIDPSKFWVLGTSRDSIYAFSIDTTVDLPIQPIVGEIISTSTPLARPFTQVFRSPGSEEVFGINSDGLYRIDPNELPDTVTSNLVQSWQNNSWANLGGCVSTTSTSSGFAIMVFTGEQGSGSFPSEVQLYDPSAGPGSGWLYKSNVSGVTALNGASSNLGGWQNSCAFSNGYVGLIGYQKLTYAYLGDIQARLKNGQDIDGTIMFQTKDILTSGLTSVIGDDIGFSTGEGGRIFTNSAGSTKIPLASKTNMNYCDISDVVHQVGGSNDAIIGRILEKNESANPPYIVVTGPPHKWEVGSYIEIEGRGATSPSPTPSGDVPGPEYTLTNQALASSDLINHTVSSLEGGKAYYTHAKHRGNDNTETNWSDWNTISNT